VLEVTLQFRRIATSAGEFHAHDPEVGVAWFVEVDREAIVLGSRQHPGILDGSLGDDGAVEIVKRRSGGGLVHLVPGEHVWLDVTISRDDPEWTDDVVESMTWLGEHWVHALAQLGMEAHVHRARLDADALGKLVCFASLGPGEVVDATGAKLVGISQRRTRDTARFQCTVLTAWRPERLASLLATTPAPGDLVDLRSRVAIVERPLVDIESAIQRELTRP
jgi:lipoate-protein ligase A